MTVRPVFPLFDTLHLGLMLTALAVAYVIPFELVVLAYAVLGPAHYLTEISWLHERSFFLPQRKLVWILGSLTILAIILPSYSLIAAPLCVAFVIAGAFALFPDKAHRTAALWIGVGISILVVATGPASAIIAVLLPTIIHVSFFTLVFMLTGALRSGSRFQLVLVGVYVSCLMLLIVFPPVVTAQNFGVLTPLFFGPVDNLFRKIFGHEPGPMTARAASLLSFAYTYHYLNWFIKVNIIKWHKVPKTRLAMIVLLSIGFSGLYFINYIVGFAVLLSLSMLHVVLEFPLNAISIRELGALMARPKLNIP